MVASDGVDPCPGGSQTRPLNAGGAPGRDCWACACISVIPVNISASARVILFNMILLLVSSRVRLLPDQIVETRQLFPRRNSTARCAHQVFVRAAGSTIPLMQQRFSS